jgi:hypothetical protein
MVPRYQPALSIGGESKTMESSLFQRRERLGEGRPLSPHPPIQPTDSQIEGEEDTNLGGRIVQGRESSTIRGDFPLLGMEIIFSRPASEEEGAIQIVD